MAQKLEASMPEALDLDTSWTVQFAAVDPVSGAAVSGVNVSDAAIIADQVARHRATAIEIVKVKPGQGLS